ncbi:HutD family protein [Burkholderia ubonensis]|uniref:HutD/Ves family protein n=1 Tax=Burkholderia ubonensis TaxID=101571 RepID=UPI000758709F|nr:HutD family protein [Burkholderia ubonensis]AOI70919.1 histidine utilization protein HutD [Burkholderia ubonensis]KUZ07464.1 histidine utilization protein HutD [Burkholderia ubonensis]KUZ20703.1 histidine utilization protein HutD [Burkholderia ubonensis]KUZ41994.1 histidine utilization protein HutD [Burkholderia ubonensis]KUZ56800.1 histidine utilization protein HutD [Burkholderia ubonensis]
MTALDQAPVNATMIRAADLVASPWKNGGGVTREIAAYSPKGTSFGAPPGAALDAFAWRVSVADVAAAGPFSRFEGVDRTLVLLSGAGMTLAGEGGERHVLDAPLARADFAGETAIDATLHDGPTRDFNLMTRRATTRGAVAVWRAGTHRIARADTVLLFCATGTAQVALDGATHSLEELDTLRLDGLQRALDVVVSGDGALLAVSLDATDTKLNA